MWVQLYILGPTFTNLACHCLRTDRDFTDVIVETLLKIWDFSEVPN